MSYSWVACKLTTGEVIVNLPFLDLQGPVKQTIGRYETGLAMLPIDTQHAPDQWQLATLAGASQIVLLSETVDASGVVQSNPVWGCWVTAQQLDETDETTLSLATLESYLDGQYINTTKTYSQVGQNDIVADLVNSFCASGVNGIPITVQYVTAGAGTPRDRTYTEQDDKTVYSALVDLMGVKGGPEWYIGWKHLTGPERYVPVLYVGDRIGAATTMPTPNAVFSMPGPVQSFKMVRDFSAGKGANVVVATSSGQGTVRPESTPQVFTDTTRPKFEYRWTPSTSILDPATLNSWASSALTNMQNGAVSLAPVAVTTDPGCPQLGTDWNIGDDVGFDIGGLDGNGRDTVPAFPGGFKGTGRVIGYELTLDDTPLVTPIIAGQQVI